MSTEQIIAIGGLWPLALVILIGIIAILYRPQLIELLRRTGSARIKKGDVEAEFVTIEKETVISVDQKPQLPPSLGSQLVITTVSAVTPELTVSELQNLDTLPPAKLRNEMILAFIKGDLEKASQVFDVLKAKTPDQVEKFREEAYYLHLRFTRGDRDALKNLQDLAQQTSPYPVAHATCHYQLGRCFEFVSNLQAALEEYEMAAKITQTDEPRHSIATTAIAQCLFNLGRHDQAYSRLLKDISTASDSDVICDLFLALAKLYEKANETLLRVLALEKALEYRPNDTDLRFKVAYGYSNEKNMGLLTLFHYDTLLGFDRTAQYALNNLGVQYSHLGLPIHSVEHYRLAWLNKNTLAASNLAFIFAGVGFVDEARKILDEAKLMPDPDPQVGKAYSDIPERRNAEAERKRKYLEIAGEQQRFLIEFAQAYFIESNAALDVTGTWKLKDGTVAAVLFADGMVQAIWGDSDKRTKFTGKLVNRGSLVKIYKWSWIIGSGNKDFVEDGEGYAYISSQGNEIAILRLEKTEHSILTLRKWDTDVIAPS